MIFSFADLIVYVTTFMTLKPGDIISTGTPVKKDSENRAAGLAQARRHHRNRMSGDRRAAQYGGGRGVTSGEPRGVRDRLAGRTFALAAHSQLLAQAIRHRRRIPARAGAAGRIRRIRQIARRARLCRRQRHACRTRRRRSRCRSPTSGRARSALSTRCGSTAVAAFDQHRRRGISGQSRRLRTRLGSGRKQGGRARRRRRGARGDLWSACARRGASRRRQSYAWPRRNVAATIWQARAKRGLGRRWRRARGMRRSWSIPRRSACRASLLSRSTSRGFPAMPWSPILFMCPCAPRCSRRRQARGLRTADGLGMLLHQAVRGFALWFGKTPDRHAGTARTGRNRSWFSGPHKTAAITQLCLRQRSCVCRPQISSAIVPGGAPQYGQRGLDRRMKNMNRWTLGASAFALHFLLHRRVGAAAADRARARHDRKRQRRDTDRERARRHPDDGQLPTTSRCAPSRKSRSPTSNRAASSASPPCRSRTARRRPSKSTFSPSRCAAPAKVTGPGT